VLSAKISGPLYEGNFYKGYLPATDFVVWIEDDRGNYIKTVKISKGVVNVAHAGIHAEHLPVWQKTSKVHSDATVANDSLSYILSGFDGLTSASLKLKSPKDTTITVKWDFTDTNGNPVPEGVYKYCIETANIKKDSNLVIIILNETTSGNIVTRKRTVTASIPTKNIKSFTVNVVPIGTDNIKTDAVTSATK
jgi:flagellar hook assembly protein FlgD